MHSLRTFRKDPSIIRSVCNHFHIIYSSIFVVDTYTWRW